MIVHRSCKLCHQIVSIDCIQHITSILSNILCVYQVHVRTTYLLCEVFIILYCTLYIVHVHVHLHTAYTTYTLYIHICSSTCTFITLDIYMYTVHSVCTLAYCIYYIYPVHTYMYKYMYIQYIGHLHVLCTNTVHVYVHVFHWNVISLHNPLYKHICFSHDTFHEWYLFVQEANKLNCYCMYQWFPIKTSKYLML